ncbi:MAG: isocitrate lyase/phosphoenolpyruvate mutase family protein [bacterium]|nr:isocitrate lyase/phosphoenolpyruvate mutase family protein [bacterium]
MPTVDEKRRAFRDLHASGCFVMPNPWDVGSARWLQHLGFPALATTSAGAAFGLGLPDSDAAVGCEVALAHVAAVAAATDVPVNADFASGYARAPEDVAANVGRCLGAGIAGLSIEDATDDPAAPLLDFTLAVERVRAAAEAAGPKVVLTARAECFLVGRPDLDETVRRLHAYADAGADCLFAPGLRTRDEIAAVVAAVAPKAVNVLVGAASGFTVDELAGLGVRRLSVGSGLARTAWGGFVRAARALAGEGRFDAMADATPHAELDAFFRADLPHRPDRTPG